MFRILPIALLIPVTVLLGACAGTGTKPPDAAPASVTALSHWTASGKAALRGPDGVESATVRFEQAGDVSRLRLSGPFGAGATELHKEADTLTVNRDGVREVIDLADPDAVIALTGWDLPIGAMPYWLRGLPDPGSAPGKIVRSADDTVITRIEQDGWQIDYADHAQVNGLLLPEKLVLRNQAYRLTVLVRNWQLAAP